MQLPRFNLQGKCGWFYIIQLSHNKTWGFGITLNPESRLRKGYCNPSAERQLFYRLYYGNYNQIRALERHLKNEMSNKMLVLFSEKLEWFDPVHGIDGKKIVRFVEDRCKAVYPDIYRINDRYLPFSPCNIFKDIKNIPDDYLDIIS